MSKERLDSDGYHYKECGLDNIWLSNGFELVDSDYGEGVIIHEVEKLNLAIGRDICGRPRLDGKQFKFLRRQLGLSQKRLGKLMGVEEQTISLWERGQSTLPLCSEILLRTLFMQSTGSRVKLRETLEELADLDAEIHELGRQLSELKFQLSDTGNWKNAA